MWENSSKLRNNESSSYKRAESNKTRETSKLSLKCCHMVWVVTCDHHHDKVSICGKRALSKVSLEGELSRVAHTMSSPLTDYQSALERERAL